MSADKNSFWECLKIVFGSAVQPFEVIRYKLWWLSVSFHQLTCFAKRPQHYNPSRLLLIYSFVSNCSNPKHYFYLCLLLSSCANSKIHLCSLSLRLLVPLFSPPFSFYTPLGTDSNSLSHLNCPWFAATQSCTMYFSEHTSSRSEHLEVS